MRELIRYAKTPRYPCNTQSPQLGFNELDVQFSRSKRGPERIASVHAALERSEAAGLYYGSERKILKQAVLKFLVHGLRYVFYAQPGPLSRGFGYGYPDLNMTSLTLRSKKLGKKTANAS